MKNQTKTQNMINGQSEPMKLIFNYNNVFYSFYYNDFSGCVHRSREYAMNYVYSGEMILDNGKEQIHVGKGECIFIPFTVFCFFIHGNVVVTRYLPYVYTPFPARDVR